MAEPQPEAQWSSSASDDGGSADEDCQPAPATKRKPRFKSAEELAAHEAEVERQALADKATMKRLEEVRARRAKAKAEREAREKAEAERAARQAEAVAAQEAKSSSAERPTLDMPGPKEYKSCLLTLQNIADDDFLKKHSLKGAGGNKLAKIKGAAFKKIFEDFQANADVAQLHAYIDES